MTSSRQPREPQESTKEGKEDKITGKGRRGEERKGGEGKKCVGQ